MFSEVKRAWAFWVLANQSFAATFHCWASGKEPALPLSLENKRTGFTQKYSERLQTVQIECSDALKVIGRCDCPDTFFYCDPPYINSNQGHFSGYSQRDYTRLLKKLSFIKGKFLLSSYPSTILSGFIENSGWKTRQIEKAVAVTKNTQKRKTEVLVWNYPENAPV